MVLHQQFGASGTARERHPVFVGSQRSLAKYGQYGLTQRLGAASFSSSAYNRAARVNYKMLAKLSGLDEGDVVRLDLEIEAHLGSTLQPGDCLIIEKGNRLKPERLDEIKRAVQRQTR